jgi:hypothetical protein
MPKPQRLYRDIAAHENDLVIAHDIDGDVSITLDGLVVCWIRADEDGTQRIMHTVDGRCVEVDPA